MKRLPVKFILAVGFGLIAAPAIFQMFTRAPLGGQMIEEFGPYMSRDNIQKFQGYLDEIDRAQSETRDKVRPLFGERLGVQQAEFDRSFRGVAEFNSKWPGIYSDMSSMLRTMDANRDNFAAVDALPPFKLFPWFFVAPGVIAAGLAFSALRRDRKGTVPKASLRLLVLVGLGLIAAPAIFQMFTRAPLGGGMINDFRPLMTTKKVTTIQGYFLVIGGGEGDLRLKAKRALEDRLGFDEAEYSRQFPAVSALEGDWARISRELSPMIGVMSDNVDNFQAVDALPPFPLFPWFFVAPGLLVAGLALAAGRSREATTVVIPQGGLNEQSQTSAS